MKTILVPTDFSSCAKNSTDFACELAIKNMTDLCLFHSYFIPYSNAGSFVDYSDKVRSASKELLDEEVLRLLNKYPEMKNLGIDTKLTFGDLDTEVNILTKTNEYALIVMGSKGCSDLEELIMGSQTARMIEVADLPILVVPSGASFKEANDLLFATDLKEKISQQDKDVFEGLMNSKSAVHVYHNYDDFRDIDEKQEKRLLKGFQDNFSNKIDFDVHFDRNNIESIELYAEKIKADLIVVRKHHEGFLKSLFTVSVSKSLSYHVKVPMVVLR